jgi:hypothetical protein
VYAGKTIMRKHHIHVQAHVSTVFNKSWFDSKETKSIIGK